MRCVYHSEAHANIQLEKGEREKRKQTNKKLNKRQRSIIAKKGKKDKKVQTMERSKNVDQKRYFLWPSNCLCCTIVVRCVTYRMSLIDDVTQKIEMSCILCPLDLSYREKKKLKSNIAGKAQQYQSLFQFFRSGISMCMKSPKQSQRQEIEKQLSYRDSFAPLIVLFFANWIFSFVIFPSLFPMCKNFRSTVLAVVFVWRKNFALF